MPNFEPLVPKYLTSTKQDASGLSSMSFCDAQEQACALTGWNQNYLQLSAGIFKGDVCQVQGQSIKLFIEHVQQSMLQTGELPCDILALGIPLTTSGSGMFSGQTCGAGDLHVFSGVSGFEFRPSQRHTMLGIELQLDRGWLDTEVEQSEKRGSPALPNRSCVLKMAPAALVAFKTYLLDLFQSAQTDPALLANPIIVANIADYVLDYLVSLSHATDASSQRCSQWNLVTHARDRIHETQQQTMTVAQLCQMLGVSRRTLQNGFQQILGIGPLAYVKAFRLTQTRKMLKQGSCVTDAATANGFWHFGHFSHDYKMMFGECPSVTLRRYV